MVKCPEETCNQTLEKREGGIFFCSDCEKKFVNTNKPTKGDWVRVAGEGTDAFMVIGVKGKTVILQDGCTEPLHKVEKLDLDKYEVSSYIVHSWHKREEK